MRKVYVDLLCGRFTMLCAFFVYHDLGYKCSDDLGRERFDIDKFFCEGYEFEQFLYPFIGTSALLEWGDIAVPEFVNCFHENLRIQKR